MAKDAFITFKETDIKRIINKPDVDILYTYSNETWVLDNKFKPVRNDDGTIKYKLAVKR